ncbi:MAG: RNA polymerase sigma factor [Solirubrobacteraceae bacterium]
MNQPRKRRRLASPRVGDSGDLRIVSRAPHADLSAGARDPGAGLVALAQAGDERAFEELVALYRPRVWRVLLRITRDRELADDALQEALIRAWQNIDRFQGRSSFFTWMTRIAINEGLREVKRNQAAAALVLDDAVGERVPGWGDRPDELFESREFLSAVDSALARLPIDYRVAVVLRDVEGLSTADSAGVLDIGERALKSRLHRGRMALRRELDTFFTQD